ncbi:MAG TPA: NlpC/P60 family protein, partial [Nakamurella sp.]
MLTLAAGIVTTVSLAGAAVADPVTPLSPAAPSGAAVSTTAGIPVCLPGRESTPQSGAGTPAPLGILQGVPDELKSGGSFAGIPLDARQVEMAATIVAVGKQMGITRRGIEIGLSVATEQSSLRPDAINKDWLGLFQQNPVTYTQYRRTEPGGAAWMFFDQLITLVPQYDTDPRADYEIGDVIQKTTTGVRFAAYQNMARDLTGRLIDAVSLHQDDVTCTPAPAVQATTGSGFDPGNIISDAVFYDTAAMTVDQIRAFLRAEGEGCTGPYCLKNLTVTTAGQAADRYCAAYQGGVNGDAATVIAKVSTACGINPQVMLVTLQKESALLDRTDPTAATYDAAWGWHCPDTGPGGSANCDPAYAGFFNQAYGMAKQWSRYRLDPQNYNYHAGQTVDILWNVVESGCGSAPVSIQNTATASLYNYTPYQPNAAALAGYPGVGDACSTYGNRNFFYLFRKYFGSTGGGASTTASAVLATGTAVKIPNNQYVSAALAGQTITAPNAAVAAGLAAGFSALGLPYVWGGGGSGAGPNNGCSRGGGDFNSCGTEIGFDCSGLTAYVLGMAGYQTPGDSGSQRAGGTSISWAQALPGDIVGFPGHVAIYLGTFGGRPYILEASWVGTPIHIVPLTRTDFDDRVHRYWTGTAVSPPKAADFASVVLRNSGSATQYGYAPTVGYTYSATGSSIAGGGAHTYLPNIPRIQPRAWPAP